MEDIIVVAVKGMIACKGKVLIIQRSDDDEIGAAEWEFAGGKIAFGEDLEAALIREAKEEVGLSVIVDKLLYAVTFKTNEHRQVVILTYLCTAHEDGVILSDEHKDYLWADKKQMMSLLSTPIIDDINRNGVWEYILLS